MNNNAEDNLKRYAALNSSIKDFEGNPELLNGEHCINFLKARLQNNSNVVELLSSDRFILMSIIHNTLLNIELDKYKTDSNKEIFEIIRYEIQEEITTRKRSKGISEPISFNDNKYTTLRIILSKDTNLYPFTYKRFFNIM